MSKVNVGSKTLLPGTVIVLTSDDIPKEVLPVTGGVIFLWRNLDGQVRYSSRGRPLKDDEFSMPHQHWVRCEELGYRGTIVTTDAMTVEEANEAAKISYKVRNKC